VLAHIPILLIRRTGGTNYYSVTDTPHSIGMGLAQHRLPRERPVYLGFWLDFGYPLDYDTVFVGCKKAHDERAAPMLFTKIYSGALNASHTIRTNFR
jgi:hypothetical protein